MSELTFPHYGSEAKRRVSEHVHTYQCIDRGDWPDCMRPEEDTPTEALYWAGQIWCRPENVQRTMDVEFAASIAAAVEPLMRSRDGWEADALLYAKNSTHYKVTLSRALDLLERHQWKLTTSFGDWGCVACRGRQTQGHKPDCELAQLLAESGREVRYAE